MGGNWVTCAFYDVVGGVAVAGCAGGAAKAGRVQPPRHFSLPHFAFTSHLSLNLIWNC